MSLFSWFTRKPASAQPRMAEPSGLLNADATVPMTPGRDGRPVAPAAPTEHAANRKNERMERRELLYAVVRDAMVRAAVLSASYKFKVLSLDQRGRQFLVMMDLASEYGGDTARLSEIEALIAQTAKSRYDISVNAVYWRLNDHVAVGVPLQGVPPARTPAAAQPRPAVSPARAQAAAAAAPARPAAPGAVPPTAPVTRAAAARLPSKPTRWLHSSRPWRRPDGLRPRRLRVCRCAPAPCVLRPCCRTILQTPKCLKVIHGRRISAEPSTATCERSRAARLSGPRNRPA